MGANASHRANAVLFRYSAALLGRGLETGTSGRAQAMAGQLLGPATLENDVDITVDEPVVRPLPEITADEPVVLPLDTRP